MTVSTNITDVITRIAQEDKALRTLVNGNQADLASLTTTDKTNLVAALNEIKGLVDNIDVTSQIQTAIDALVNGAGAAYDTLSELATEIQGNDTELASLLTAVGNRLRFDAAQTLSAAQKIQGNTNLGSVSSADFGDVDADYLATYNTVLSS